MGKNVGDDLREGKPTLPLIIAMEHGTRGAAPLIRARYRARRGETACRTIVERSCAAPARSTAQSREAARGATRDTRFVVFHRIRIAVCFARI